MHNAAMAQVADTTAYLRDSIVGKKSCYIGKPLSVLLDSLRANRIYTSSTWETSNLIFSDDQPAHTLPMDTAWIQSFRIYFGKLYGSGGAGYIHEDNPNINTHLRWIDLTFTQKIPIPFKITGDRNLAGLFGPVEPICRPYIVASIQVGEY
jgi:hypothetical protein